MKKAELIYEDQISLNATKRRIEKGIENLNTFFRMAVSEIGEFTPDQIKDIPSNGIEMITAELKTRFQFPQASDEFNLQALGIDAKKLFEYYKRHQSTWNGYEIEFKDGQFIASEIQPLLEQFRFYADTPARKKLITLSKRLAKVLNELKETGLYMADLKVSEGVGKVIMNKDGRVFAPFVLNKKVISETFHFIDKHGKIERKIYGHTPTPEREMIDIKAFKKL